MLRSAAAAAENGVQREAIHREHARAAERQRAWGGHQESAVQGS